MQPAELLLMVVDPLIVGAANASATDRMFAYGAVAFLVALIVWHGANQPRPPKG